MKLTATMMLTVDGVYQGPGGPDEDRRGGFERGGWAAPFGDEETWRFITSVFERADALLLGRKTWDIWAAYWPHHDEGDPVSHGINVLPKYVPSTTLTDPAWQNTHVIDGDVEAAVRELKAKPGRELQVHGSGDLLRWLLERDLVDELNLRLWALRLFPVEGQTADAGRALRTPPERRSRPTPARATSDRWLRAQPLRRGRRRAWDPPMGRLRAPSQTYLVFFFFPLYVLWGGGGGLPPGT